MDYIQAINDLIAYMQRNDVLSTGETVYEELSEILGWTEEEIEQELF